MESNTPDHTLADILSREDLFFIVDTFYKQVRADEVLGPIFNSHIQDWPDHLEKITDFWNVQLFGEKGYRGNPIVAHQQVDEQNNHSITPEHFGTWLRYWMNTINSNFSGKNTELLKERTRKMQTVLYLKIFENRQRLGVN